MANYNIDAIYNGSTSLPGTERVRIDGAGNIGIGASTPLTRLFVSGSSSVNENLPTTYIRNSFPGTHGYGLSVSRSGSDTSALCFGSDSSLNSIIASNNTDLRIGKGQSNTFTEYIRVNTNGNVGIGTSSPNSKLHVVGTTSMFQTAGNTYLAFDHSGITTWRFGAFADNSSTLYIGCDVSGGNFNNKVLTLTNGGNVGIGTTNPIAKLHVSGSTIMMGDANTFRPRQTIVGTKTGAASTTYTKIFSCGHTSTGIINVIAIITSAATASATATFSFANAYGLGATPNRISYVSVNSTITSIDCIYNNTGYIMSIAVTYSGATAPTLYFTAEGMGSENWAL